MRKKFQNNERYKEILRLVGGSDDFYFESLFNELIEEVNNPLVEDIWLDDDIAISYWLYVANNIHDTTELDFIKNLLLWKEINGKANSRVKCVHSTDDKNYNCCVKHFKLKSFPSLIISDTPNFENFNIFKRSEIKLIRRYNPVSFFNRIHSYILTEENFNNVSLHCKELFNESNYTLTDLKILVSSNRLKEAFINLQIMIAEKHEKSNEITLLSSRFKQLENEKNKGILLEEQYQVMKMKITNSLINLIDEIKE